MSDFKINIKLVYFLLFLLFILGAFYLLKVLILPNNGSAIKTPTKNSAYLKSHLSVDVRVDDLLSYMTLEEKIGQMTLVENRSIKKDSDISLYGIGALLSGAGANPENNTPEGWKKMVVDFTDESKLNRLGIPILYGVDAIHGHSNIPGATVFPHFIGLGASRNEMLVEEIAAATARELVATNVQWSFSPTLDMPRDIRWGRVYETFADDPEIVSSLGVAYIKGLQSESVMSTPKHFVGLGGMLWGTAVNKDYKIDQGYTEADELKLRNEYLIPFKSAIDTGAKSVMVGLNSWGDTKLSASEYLLTDVLKGELGFDGFTVSDWYGVYEIHDNHYESAIAGINAGVDMVMLPFDYKGFIRNVSRAVRSGEISEERIMEVEEVLAEVEAESNDEADDSNSTSTDDVLDDDSDSDKKEIEIETGIGFAVDLLSGMEESDQLNELVTRLTALLAQVPEGTELDLKISDEGANFLKIKSDDDTSEFEFEIKENGEERVILKSKDSESKMKVEIRGDEIRVESKVNNSGSGKIEVDDDSDELETEVEIENEDEDEDESEDESDDSDNDDSDSKDDDDDNNRDDSDDNDSDDDKDEDDSEDSDDEDDESDNDSEDGDDN